MVVLRRQVGTGLGSMRVSFAPWADPGAKPMVRFEAVSKRYAETAAVDGLTLDIYEREFFALLGPSGSGKTTLLRLLAGFERPDEGRILLDGKDITHMPPYRRPINMMFQSYALFPHLSVAGNIAFGLRQEGLPRREISSRVDELLAMVKLEGFGARRPHQLSGGQRQRVALARSLAKRPKVLLLDEPLAALDKKLRTETQFELTKLQEELGTTFVIVTHDQEEAMTMAHRMAVMDRGRLIQVATPSEIYEQPASRWVADFIGDVNLLEGEVEALQSGTVKIAGKNGEPLRLLPGSDIWPGMHVWVALRPEKIQISKETPKIDLENCLRGVVQDIAYRGNVVMYKVRMPSGHDMMASTTNQARLFELPLSRGDEVWLSWVASAGVILTH
jgi:putrescine transport system ATP-binding protein